MGTLARIDSKKFNEYFDAETAFNTALKLYIEMEPFDNENSRDNCLACAFRIMSSICYIYIYLLQCRAFLEKNRAKSWMNY